MFECLCCGEKTLIWNSDYCYDEVLGDEGENGVVSILTCSNEECDVEIMQVHTWDENEENDEYFVYINRYDLDGELVEERVYQTDSDYVIEKY